MNNQPITRKRRLNTRLALGLYCLAGMIGIASCASDSEDMGIGTGSDTAIHFALTDPTRATPVVTNDLKKIGIFGYSHLDTWANTSANNTPDYFLNKALIKKGDTWYYDGVIKFWPGDERKVSFFAYAPYSDVEGTFDKVYPEVSTDPGAPSITYTVPTDVTQQIDLLWDINLNETYATSSAGKVTFTMSHALTQIGFTAKRDAADAHSLLEVKVTEVFLQYVSGTGTLNLEDGSWETLFPEPGKNDEFPEFKLLPGKGGGLDEVTLANGQTTSVRLNSPDGYFMIVPQKLTGRTPVGTTPGSYVYDALLLVTYDLIDAASHEVISSETKPFTLSGSFEAGKNLTYDITFDTSASEVTLSLTKTIEPWVDGADMPDQSEDWW